MTATELELARFAAQVANRLGLRIDDDRASELLVRRAAGHRESIAAYLDRVDRVSRGELRAVVGELTVGETYFLRHVEQFRAFIDIAAPDRLARGALRVLSAGCSTGEEAYTLAMLLREALPAAPFTIRAIDLNPRSIEHASAGRYSRWSLRAVSPAFEQRWFRPDGRELVVASDIRGAVTFAQSNLLDDPELGGPARWDVVFCRNVLMYFTEDQADAVLTRIALALAPGGYLFLGHAETLRGKSDDFALCHTHGTFYYQRLPVTAPVGAPVGDVEWHEDIRASSERVQALVDGALAPSERPPPPAWSAVLRRSPPAPEPPSWASASRQPAASELTEIRDLFADEQFGLAIERLDQLRARGVVDSDAALLRALALTHAGRFAEARSACAELMTSAATSAGANYLLALCCDSTGDTTGAAQLAQTAAELDPSFAMPRVHLALLARRLGDRQIATRELTRAIALLESELPARLALYGGGFSRQTLLGMCRAELAAIGGAR